ncbi:FAD-binding oxidoreductase [Halioxenophilus sp. WMMB6]|uniref:FAD-binding oxidoreductase n=1 Tax=Halioxenophilus sp. WMMB6 TaxID=3073815 RepID=UPI00295F3A17|nr:FAD-binding oxidoreductase [Halioxenophilus sp. WMMB6]
MTTNTLKSDITAIVGDANITFEAAALASGSKDSFHFSPVLLEDLDGKSADLIVRPETQAQLVEIVRYAVANRIPITPRGAGTGNYGQGVPMQGGILVNTKKLNRIIELTSDYARVECGTVLWQIEKQAAQVGAELRIFPSTMPTSSSAGFITGGSGGVGSITWGMLSDNNNVRAVKALTIEAEPQVLELTTPEEIRDVLHNCGVTAFVTEVEFALAPKTQWHQYAFAFDDLYSALAAGEKLAHNTHILKRLCSVFEWPIPSFFLPLVKKEACPEGKALLLLMCNLEPSELVAQLGDFDGRLTFHAPPVEESGRGFQIYDFTWNHTTMWAMKTDKQYTYLQDSFDKDNYMEQLRARKAKYGDQVLTHVEFLQSNGEIRPGGLSLVHYQSREQLFGLIDYCESIGMRISNPHTHFLDADIRWYGDYLLAARKRWDPNSLLNPGHLRALEE